MTHFIFVFLFAMTVQGQNIGPLPADIIIIDGQVYKIQNPKFFKDVKSQKDFKKEPFYLDFMGKVLDDPALLQSKSKDPVFEIDDCISRNLTAGRSLQVSAINCYSKEIDSNYRGYGAWKEKDGSEVLSIPATKSPFLVGYLTNINLDKDGKSNKKEERATCLKNPNDPSLNCYKYDCNRENSGQDIQEYGLFISRRDWCGKTFCPSGQAFLIENIKLLDSFYAREEGSGRTEVGRNSLNLSKQSIKQIIGVKSKDFDAKKACFACPPGSKMNDYGNQCIDQNGCDAVVETYSLTHKKCISRYENHNLKCSLVYEDLISSITQMRDNEITMPSFFLNYTNTVGIGIDSNSISAEKKSKFINEFIIRSTQAIDRYSLRAKTCKDGDEIIDDFRDELVEIASKYVCEKNSKGHCKSASCLRCEGQHLNFQQKIKNMELPRLRVACGTDITEGFLINMAYGRHYSKFADIYEALRTCGAEEFVCPEFSMTEQEVIEYAIRAGFDCARYALVKTLPTKSTGKR